MNENYIYESNNEERLSEILFEIKNYILKEDIFSPYMEKETILYNHPELTKLSEYGITTDTFNLINSDYFHKLSILPNEIESKLKKIEDANNEDLFQDDDDDLDYELSQDEISQWIDDLPNIKFFSNINNAKNLNILNSLKVKNPIIKLSDRDFLNILKVNNIISYEIIKKEIDNVKNDDYIGIRKFNSQDKKFLINFKQKTMPNFMEIFNKLINSNEKDEALHFSEFFAASVGQEASKLTNLGFSIFAHSFFSHNFNNFFSSAVVSQIYKSEYICETKRQILIQEGSKYNSIPSEILRSLTTSLTLNKNNYKF